MRRVKLLRPVFVLLALCCAGHVYAGLIGTNVTSQYYAYGGPYSGFGSPATFVANGTVQQTFCGSGCGPLGFNLIITDSQIEYDLVGSDTWSPSAISLNGDGLYIANGNLLTFSGVTILGVTLDGSSDLAGFTAANVTFNANNVAIDWAGLTATDGERVVLDVTSNATTVPEPAAWINMLLAVAAACLWRRFRRQHLAA